MKAAFIVHALLCVTAATVPLLLPSVVGSQASRHGQSEANDADGFTGWPTTFEGRPLTRLPAGKKDARFLSDGPGRVARFTDGEHEIVIRFVNVASRHLHPARVCFRSFGHTIQALPATRDDNGATWGRFSATRDDETLEVRECIQGPDGASWPDVTTWYWDVALTGKTGPWWAFTVAR